MKIVYQDQPLYSNNPPELTPREVAWITPENIREYHFLQALASGECKMGFTGIGKDCLIISHYNK